MFFPLGALGSFGSGATEGFGTGLDIREKLLDLQAERQLGQNPEILRAIQEQMGIGALSSLVPQPSPPGTSSTQPPQQDAGTPAPGSLPGQVPGVMAGAFPPVQAAMQPGPAAAAPGQPGAQRQPFPLAAARDPVRQELERTPGLLTRLDKITTAEVGNDPAMRQMFQETVINRAAADQMPLAAVLSDRSYFPSATFLRAQREGGTGQGVSPQMWAGTAPSNLTGYGTGNASIDPRTGRPVGFAGGPQTAMRGGEQYGIEGRNLPWAQSMGYGGPARTPLGRAGPQAPQDAGRTDPEVVTRGSRKLQTGDPLSMPELAQLIERQSPGVDPAVKFRMMKKALGLMSQTGQTQFNQAMQIAQYEQRERMHQDTLARQQQTEELREKNYLRRDPYYVREADAAKSAQKNLTNNELRTEKVKGHIAALSELAKKVQVTGNVTIDSWLQSARTKLGWPDATYFQYQKQLQDLQSEIGAMSQQTLGSLTVSAREDAKQLAHGILTPSMLQSLGEAIRIDSKITRQASQKLIDKHQRNINEFMRSGGVPPEAEPEEEETAPTTGAGTSAPATSGAEGWGTSTVVKP